MLPGLPGACLLWDGVGVCAACMPGLADLVACGRVCVCAYGFRACPACVIRCHLGKFPAFPGLHWRDRFGCLV